MIAEGISEESRRILGDKVLRKLMMHLVTKVELDDRSILEKILDSFSPGITNLDMAKMSPFYGTYRAKPYFKEAYKRRKRKLMMQKEEDYLLNTDFQKVTEDYLSGKINFK